MASILVHAPAAVGIYSVPVLLQGLARLRPRSARGEAWLLLWILAVALPVTLTVAVNRFYLPDSLGAGEHVLAISLHNRPGGSSDLRIAEISLQGVRAATKPSAEEKP